MNDVPEPVLDEGGQVFEDEGQSLQFRFRIQIQGPRRSSSHPTATPQDPLTGHLLSEPGSGPESVLVQVP